MFYKSETAKIPRCPNRERFYKGLMTIDKTKRLGSSNNGLGFEIDLKAELWLKDINWDLIVAKKLQPPYRPNVAFVI